MLSLEDVCKQFRKSNGPIVAVDGLSLSVSPGEVVVLRGPSGCGKSTALLAAGGLQQPDRGVVRIDDKDLYALSGEARSRFRAETIGFVFQQFHLIPYLTAHENVLAASLARGANSDDSTRAEELLEQFGLVERARHLPSELSTGESQRCALARALLNRPKLLLADEPTGNLDRDNSSVVLDELRAFAQRGGAVLLVTHDEQAAAVGDRQLTMSAGRLVESA